MKYKRIFLLILDSLGIGATHDSDKYGDGLANTFENVIKTTNVELPNLKALGILKLLDETDDETYGYYTKAIPHNVTKSSLVSHLEMMGLFLDKEYKILDLEKIQKETLNFIYTEIDRKFIIVPRDTDENIINKYGTKQMKTGNVIIEYNHYTIKIFAHESYVPPKELIRIASTLMRVLTENNYLINRVVAINFSGQPNAFVINKNVSIIPMPRPNETVLELLKKQGYKVLTIGKSTDIFSNSDMTNVCKTISDIDTIKKLLKSTSFNFNGVCIANLSDLNYHGHKRDIEAYSKTLKGFDNCIPLIIDGLKEDDLLIITSDQGNDPTYSGDDHTREKVPVFVFNSNFEESGELPYLQTLADIGATIADNFGIKNVKNGTSFLERLK